MSQSDEPASQTFPTADPAALARFGRLAVVAARVVEGFMVGQHASPFKGANVEFIEHRQYNPGDELRHIDWRVLGKTDKYYVKEFEDETNVRAYLLVDASASMAYAASTLSKLDYARFLAACFGYLLLLQRDAAGLIAFDFQVRYRFEPTANLHHFQKLLGQLESLRAAGETRLGDVLQTIVPSLKRRSLVVLLSDCLDELSGLARGLEQFRHAQHDVIVFHLVAPEEVSFPFNNPAEFRSLEQPGYRKHVDPHQLRADYLERFEAHCTELARVCGGMGADYVRIETSRPYEQALGSFLELRRLRKRRPKNSPPRH